MDVSLHLKVSVFATAKHALFRASAQRPYTLKQRQSFFASVNVANGNRTRSNNPIRIGEYLDLIEDQMPQHGHIAPLRYRLSSVLYYGGPDNKRGYWQASVRGTEHAYEVNDTRVTELCPASRLWKTPHKLESVDRE